MKLTFKDEFSIEYEKLTLNGTFTNLNRKEIKAFEAKHKGSEDSDDMFKERLEMSIESDDKGAIMAIGEEYNYKIIFQTIIKDIADKKAGN